MDDELLKLFGIDPKKLVAKVDATRVRRTVPFKVPRPTRTVGPLGPTTGLTPEDSAMLPRSRVVSGIPGGIDETIKHARVMQLLPVLGAMQSAAAGAPEAATMALAADVLPMHLPAGATKSLGAFLDHLVESKVISLGERGGLMEARHGLWMNGVRDVDALNAPINKLLAKKGERVSAPRMFADSVVARAAKRVANVETAFPFAETNFAGIRTKQGEIFRGADHAEAVAAANAAGHDVLTSPGTEQGFILRDGSFIPRAEGQKKILQAAAQITNERARKVALRSPGHASDVQFLKEQLPSAKTSISLTPDRSPLPVAGNSGVTEQQRAFEENLARGKTALPDSVAARAATRFANPEVLDIVRALRTSPRMPVATSVDAPSAQMMAKIYSKLPKNDPKARAAYDALNTEVDAQYKALTDKGYKFEFTSGDPYKNSAEMMQDMRDNKRLKVFKTPADNFHPYMTPDQNDKFRAVHDAIAHAGEGNQFGPIGEENAFRVHASTLSPKAQQALATETRGQNSWVNYGPNAHLPLKERPFAEQKAALWPKSLLGDYGDMAPPPNAPTVITAPREGNVLDESKLGLDVPAGVDVTRPAGKYPVRADLSVLDGMTRRFRDVYTPNALRALRDTPKAAGWYDTSELRRAMASLSPEGQNDFNMFMRFMGPTSAGTKVPDNVRQASWYYQQWKRDPAGFTQALRDGSVMPPEGFRNRLGQKGINKNILKVIEGDGLDVSTAPKTSRYTSALALNNWGGGALDMHVGRQVGLAGRLQPSGYDPRTRLPWPRREGRGYPEPTFGVTGYVQSSPERTHYMPIEDMLVREANKLNIAPTQYQALGWTGGAKQTGIDDARTMLEILNDKFRTSATKFGHASPLDAFKAFASGRSPLWALMGAAGLGGGGLLYDNQQR